MQYLVDRDFISQDIYRGLAQPMITHVAPRTSTSRPSTTSIAARTSGTTPITPTSRSRRHDRGRRGAGGDNVWQFGGQPIRIKFIARVEDERRQIGDLVASELEDAGFEVAMTYQPFAPAIQTVYSTDPRRSSGTCTPRAGAAAAAQRYDDSTINSMNAPWMGNMPGWREQGFWQYEDPEQDELGQKLFRGEFASVEERNDLYRQMTQHGARGAGPDLARQRAQHLPGHRRTLTDATVDVVGRPALPVDAPVGATSRARTRSGWATCGSGPSAPPGTPSAASVTPTATTSGATCTTRPSPTTPSRACPSRSGRTTTVKTAGPDGKLDVPADAVTWDAANGHVGAGRGGHDRRSASVTFDYSKYLGSHWHDGQPITIARRRLFHRAGLRHRLRRGQGTRSRRPSRRRPAVPRDLQGLPPHRRRPGRGVRRLLALRRRPDRGVCQPDLVRACPGRSWRPWTTSCSTSAAPPTAIRPRRATTCPG